MITCKVLNVPNTGAMHNRLDYAQQVGLQRGVMMPNAAVPGLFRFTPEQWPVFSRELRIPVHAG